MPCRPSAPRHPTAQLNPPVPATVVVAAADPPHPPQRRPRPPRPHRPRPPTRQPRPPTVRLRPPTGQPRSPHPHLQPPKHRPHQKPPLHPQRLFRTPRKPTPAPPDPSPGRPAARFGRHDGTLIRLAPARCGIVPVAKRARARRRLGPDGLGSGTRRDLVILAVGSCPLSGPRCASE